MLNPRLGDQAWKIVHRMRAGDRLTCRGNLFYTYSPSGEYGDQRFPASAVRELQTQGVIGSDFQPTQEGTQWLA